MATKGGSVIFTFEGDDSQLKKTLSNVKKETEKTAKANAVASGALSAVIKQQEKDLQQLKQKYIDVANTQGKNSAEALNLKKQYNTLSQEFEKNKNVINSLEKELTGLKDTSKSVSSALSKVGTSIKSGLATSMKAGAVAVGAVSTAIGSLVGYGAKFNAEIEQYRTSFEVMTGSAEEAKKLVEDLKTMGAETPFELSDLAQTTQLLMNYGFTADEAKNRLKMLGDISQGSAEKMNRVAMAYGQMSSAGKVQLEDIKQMIEAGFNPLTEISESTGESMSSLYDRISKGTLSVDEITASMQRSTAEGGKYFQSMEKQSKTVNGQISTLQDNFKSLAGTLAGGFSNELAEEVLPSLNNSLGELQKSFEKGGFEGFATELGNQLAKGVTAIAEQAPKFVDMGVTVINSLIQGLVSNMPAIATGLVQVAVSLINGIIQILPMIVQGIITGIQTLLQMLVPQIPIIIQNLINGIIQIYTAVAQALPTMLPMIIEGILSIIPVLLSNIPLFIDVAIQLMMGLIDGLINSIPVLVDSVPAIIEGLVQAFVGGIPRLITVAPQLIMSLARAIVTAIPSLLYVIPQIIGAIVNGLIGGLVSIKDVGKNMIKGLWEGMNDTFNWLMKKINSFADSIMGGIKSFFGIHSPSKEFAWVGKMNVLGLEEGMEDMKGRLNATIQGMINMSPSLLASASNSYSPNINVAVNNSFEQDPLGQMVQSRKTFASGAKNDYNFGMGVSS